MDGWKSYVEDYANMGHWDCVLIQYTHNSFGGKFLDFGHARSNLYSTTGLGYSGGICFVDWHPIYSPLLPMLWNMLIDAQVHGMIGHQWLGC